MKQLFDGVYLLEGQVGLRPLYLPLLMGDYGALLLDTGCAEHVDNLIRPVQADLGSKPAAVRFGLNTHPAPPPGGGSAGVKRFPPPTPRDSANAHRAVIEDPEALFQTRYDAYRQF